MEIRRDFYLDKLIKRKNNGLIKVITGIRRCGKSYLLPESVKFNASQPIKSQYFLMFKVFLQVLPLSPIG